MGASRCSIHIADRPDMLELACRSGCRILSFGIESVSPESVRPVRKTLNDPARFRELPGRVRDHVRRSHVREPITPGIV